MLFELTTTDWLLLVIAGMGVGISKSGLAGFGMLHVVIFAKVFGGRDSTGVLLPLLIVGDVCAIRMFGREVQWDYVKRLMPAALIGVLIGWLLMGKLNELAIQRLIGAIIFSLTLLQMARIWRPAMLGRFPHSLAFAYAAGILTGFTTMIANAAGPVIALYLLSVSMPKLQLVGTCAWFFFMLNSFKVPFSYELGLINRNTLLVNLLLVPTVVLGIFIGSSIVHRIPQKIFDSLLLAFTAIASLRMIGFL